MAKKDKLCEEILTYLKNQLHPVSTREIALKMDVSWHTILTRCLRLQLDGKVSGFRVGNMHLWEIKRK